MKLVLGAGFEAADDVADATGGVAADDEAEEADRGPGEVDSADVDPGAGVDLFEEALSCRGRADAGDERAEVGLDEALLAAAGEGVGHGGFE